MNRLLNLLRNLQSFLNTGADINDLRVPPGNRLEALGGDRESQHRIQIPENFRERICFTWSQGDANDVEIVDYH